MRKKFVTTCALLMLMLTMTSVSNAGPRHPEIRQAMDALRDARAHLQQASHDYQGHRVDAIRAIDEAMRQLEICMKYD